MRFYQSSLVDATSEVLNHFDFSDLRSLMLSMNLNLELNASEDHTDANFIEWYQSAIDGLTKPLPSVKFKSFMELIGLRADSYGGERARKN